MGQRREADEFIHYRDDGCSIAPSCLSCPLSVCRYDLPPKAAGALLRESQLRGLLSQGLTADEAAAAMGVSRRTVFRLKQQRATAAVARGTFSSSGWQRTPAGKEAAP